MKDKQKQTKDDPKNPMQQVQTKPAVLKLSDAELDKVAGGSSNLNLSKSNVDKAGGSNNLNLSKSN